MISLSLTIQDKKANLYSDFTQSFLTCNLSKVSLGSKSTLNLSG